MAHDLRTKACQELVLRVEVRGQERLHLPLGCLPACCKGPVVRRRRALKRLLERRAVKINRDLVDVVHRSNDVLDLVWVAGEQGVEMVQIACRDVLRLEPDEQHDLVSVLDFEAVRLGQELVELL